MNSSQDQYEAEDYARAAKVAAHLAKTGDDLSASERSALTASALILRSWAQSLPKK
jgi:hypothetical protein